ncbi:hypothetical protein ACP4OV_023160 [Aristida adscensionis]
MGKGKASVAYPVRPDPARTTENLLRFLRQEQERYSCRREEEDEVSRSSSSLDPDDDLARLDPEDLHRRGHDYFVMTGMKKGVSRLKTRGGQWKERGTSMEAIRGWQSEYLGARRTLGFYKHDGTPTRWRMDVYFLITPGHNPNQGFYLYIEEEMVLCTVRESWFGGESYRQQVLRTLRIHRRNKNIEEITNNNPEIQCPDRKSRKALKAYKTWIRNWCHSHDVPTSTATQQVACGKGKRARPPDGKSEVWQHFTKIHTEDPDVVYAACHCCDKMLKAHPKKHGTNHLRKHRETCRLKQHVCEEYKRYLQEMKQKISLSDYNADLGRRDPWDLPLLFIMGNKNQPPSLETLSGFWKEKEHSFVAIRDHWLNDRPVYFAVKKTLEFYRGRQDGNSTKTDWLMTRYFELHPYNDRPGDFLVLDEISMCKVFQEDKDVRPSALKDLEIFLEEEEYNGELRPELEGKLTRYMTSFGDCLVDEGDEAPPKKRPRYGASCSGKSNVWHCFSKIFNNDHVLLYGVCHSCHTMLKAPVRNGTSSLIRHGKKCSYKSLVPNPLGSSSS